MIRHLSVNLQRLSRRFLPRKLRRLLQALVPHLLPQCLIARSLLDLRRHPLDVERVEG